MGPQHLGVGRTWIFIFNGTHRGFFFFTIFSSFLFLHMSRRRSRKADSDDEDEEDFSELMERCSSPPPYPPSKRPCHRAGTASISSTAEPQSPTLPSQSLSAATSLNPNMALTTRQIAHHHRLKVAQVPELERFSLDPPNIMLMKVYAKLTALENKMASIEAAVPEYSVSASLKVGIHISFFPSRCSRVPIL